MHPVLFTLQLPGHQGHEAHEISIASYGVALACALAVGALGTLHSATRRRPGNDPQLPMELGAVISALGLAIGFGFTGALALHALAQLAQSGTLGAAPGISVWGALLGGAGGVLWLAPRLGLSGWALLDVSVPWVALAQALGRVGCFLGGCCYGRALAPHADYAAAFDGRVPVPLIEAALLLALAAFFRSRRAARAFESAPRPARPIAYLGAYACVRLMLEPLRGDAIRGVFLGGALSTAQIVAGLLLLGLAVRLGYLRAARALALLAVVSALAAAQPALAERFARLAPSRPATARFAAGTFMMGSDDAEIAFAVALCARYPLPGVLCDAASFRNEQPARRVQLAAFAIDRTEVSNAAYGRCAESGACTPRRVPEADARHGQPEQPVVLVSPLEAQAYCAFVGGRLPTEAQWERAARSGTQRRFPWGDQWNDRLANHGPDVEGAVPVDGFRFLAPVAALADGATEAGLLNMAGNVWELTADRYDPEAYANASAVEPIGTGAAGAGELRVMRGGSYASPPHTLRVAQRAALPEREPRLDVGFRCAYAPSP
jgi:formylglycine-generating enzyme required for sulfatase activity/prolipoprotein diacylglyceryltransferase